VGAYSLEELLRRWFTHDITSEQAIGQLLQILQEVELRVKRLEEKSKTGGIVSPVGTLRH
jgi:hypothetical protein